MRVLFAVIALAAAAVAAVGRDLPAPMSVNELRQAGFDTKLVREGNLEAGPGFTAYLVSYRYAGLKLHAMVAVPESPPPDGGYPVVIANHGYVPDPRLYGITSEGVDSRPGDYYRAVPGMFASRGFLTLIPDYRGHNISEGFEYIDPQNEDSVGYYAEDVVSLMASLDQLEDADTRNVFMWSHSMGGIVSMRALLATDVVRASSFWATMNVDAYRDQLAEIDGPVNVQHSIDDQATPHENSKSLAAGLADAGLLAGLSIYPDDAHLFAGDIRESAIETDVRLFREAME